MSKTTGRLKTNFRERTFGQPHPTGLIAHDIHERDAFHPATGLRALIADGDQAGHGPAFRKNIRGLLQENRHLIRGVWLSDNGRPVAYAAYQLAVGGNGERSASCHDFFIAERHQTSNVGDRLKLELFSCALADELDHLVWTADGRSEAAHAVFMRGISPHSSPVVTFVAGDPEPLATRPRAMLKTREIQPRDVDAMRDVGLSAQYIRNTGDIPFKGFATFDTTKERRLLAVTPASHRFSLARNEKSLTLGQPVFATNVPMEEIALSILAAADRHARHQRIVNVAWTLDDTGSDLMTVLSSLRTVGWRSEAYRISNAKLSGFVAGLSGQTHTPSIAAQDFSP